MTEFTFLGGQIPPAEDFGEGPSTYPVLLSASTNPNLGDDGEAVGRFIRVGPRLYFCTARFFFNGLNVDPGSGNYSITTPVPPDTTVQDAATIFGAGTHLGGGVINQAGSNANSFLVQTYLRFDDGRIGIRRDGTAQNISNNDPWIWTSGDRISVWFWLIGQEGT